MQRLRLLALLLTLLLFSSSPIVVTTAGNDEGFVSLFNGKTLDGWIGSVDGYEVVDGAIVCIPDKGGNLFSRDEYANFVLRFEFKLPPGGNSGIGVRAPLKGKTSRMGMEIQILDDTHKKFVGIKDWQAHGSIYGVAPAKRGHLKPAGEWNREEIICDGTKVKVKLNGVIIVDADLADHIGKPTLDGRNHPGLKRTTGHIGFLGHGHRVGFRNLRIKILD